VDDRLMDLEIKVAFLEKHVADLDGVIREMAQHIEILRRELAEVRDRSDGTPEKPGDERPPHY
jgi:uncharacterized coiled-coil protein SlyX